MSSMNNKDQYTSIITIDTSKPFSTIQLPWIGFAQTRTVTIKDIGGFAAVSNIIIKAYTPPSYANLVSMLQYPANIFDTGLSTYTISKNFDYVVLYPDLETWHVIGTNPLLSIPTTSSSFSTLTASSITASTLTAGRIVTNNLIAGGDSVFSTVRISSFMISNSVSSLQGEFSSINTKSLIASTIKTDSLLASTIKTDSLLASTITTSSIIINGGITVNGVTITGIVSTFSSLTVSSFITSASISTLEGIFSSINTKSLIASTIATSSITINGGITINGTNITGIVSTFSTVTVSSFIVSKSISSLQGNFSSIGVKIDLPVYEIDVSGTIRASVDIILSSDRRIKENILTIPSSLSKVIQLRGVYYNLISTLSTSRKVGFIAQEIEEVLPEVVHTDLSEDQMKSVSYANITALLTEGIKELYTKVQALEAQVSTLTFFQGRNLC